MPESHKEQGLILTLAEDEAAVIVSSIILLWETLAMNSRGAMAVLAKLSEFQDQGIVHRDTYPRVNKIAEGIAQWGVEQERQRNER